MAALCFIAASGQRKVYEPPFESEPEKGLYKVYEPPFESDPEKGLYVGVAEENILMGHQKALAMALQEYIVLSASQISGIQYSMSSSKPADRSESEETSTLTNKGSCDIEIVDRAVVEGIEHILFKIVSGGRYEYEVSDKHLNLTNVNQSDKSYDSLTFSLSYTDPATQVKMKWQFAMYSQAARKGSVTISNHVEIVSNIYYEQDE